MQQIPPEWLQQLDELLASADATSDAEQESVLVDRLLAADPELISFIVGQFAEQDSAQAAELLEMIAAHPKVPASIRAQSRASLDEMSSRGVKAPAPGTERFVAAWVQRGRERGEQILIAGWRLSGGTLEALVFLLDWRGDGLKDYYRTRHMNDTEWRQLLEHNGAKGASLTEITLADIRSLLEASIAESKRFSRPMPREYKVDSGLIERRIFHASEPPQSVPALVSPSLSPEQVVSAYVAALHYRDYLLAVELLTSEHPIRAGRSVRAAAESLRAQLKHAPRRDESVTVTVLQSSADEALLRAVGTQVVIDRMGKRLREEVSEQYVLRREGEEWRIAASE